MLASWTTATLLRIYFRNLSVHRSFLQYKSQCLEKVNVKYVIKRLWHEIFHMNPGINPRPISALQLRYWAWYGSLGLIPGPIWKMSCNNLLIHVTMPWQDLCDWISLCIQLHGMTISFWLWTSASIITFYVYLLLVIIHMLIPYPITGIIP
jgi:hypothetical protein